MMWADLLSHALGLSGTGKGFVITAGIIHNFSSLLYWHPLFERCFFCLRPHYIGKILPFLWTEIPPMPEIQTQGVGLPGFFDSYRKKKAGPKSCLYLGI